MHRRVGIGFSSDVAFTVPIVGATPSRRLALQAPLIRKALVCLFLLCAGGVLAAADLKFERWRWSNPAPHGNNVMDMLFTPSTTLQVGDSGRAYLMTEDDRWTPASTGSTNYLRGVALFAGRYVAVGEEGCILWSDNGSVFQQAEVLPATHDWFESVAASGQRAIAVGDNGSIYTSTNGLVWTKANSGSAQWLRSVAFGTSVFIAVGENGTILKSSNSSGTTWTKMTSGTVRHLNRIRYLPMASGNQFVTVGVAGTAMVWSATEALWVPVETGTTNTLFDVAANSNGTLLVGDQEIRFKPAGTGAWSSQIDAVATNAAPPWTYYCAFGSSNKWVVAGRAGLLLEGTMNEGDPGHTWSANPDSSHAWIWDVAVKKGICVAVGDLATIQTSLDGILWAREAVPEPHTNVVLLGVGGTTNLLLAAGNSGVLFASYAGLTNMVVTNYVGTNIVVTNSVFETLGLVWTNVGVFTTNTLQGVAARSDRYVVCGDQGVIFASVDGSVWSACASPTTNFLSGVVDTPEGWAAVGARGTLLRAGPDAQSWSLVPLGTTNWIYRVRYVGERVVAVGQDGTVCFSVDGVNWSFSSTGTTAWLNDVTYLDGRWWVVGTQGTLLSSPDLLQWTSEPIVTVKSLYAAACLDGKLLAAGIEGVILRNQLVPDLTPMTFLGYTRSVATSLVETNTYVNAYELFLFGGIPDQVFEFESTTNLSSDWGPIGTFEIFDPSGTIYLLRTRPVELTPSEQYYRSHLEP